MDPNKRDPTSCLLRQQATISAYQISPTIDATRKIVIKKRFSSVAEKFFYKSSNGRRFRDNNTSYSSSNRVIPCTIVINRQGNTAYVDSSGIRFTSMCTLGDVKLCSPPRAYPTSFVDYRQTHHYPVAISYLSIASMSSLRDARIFGRLSCFRSLIVSSEKSHEQIFERYNCFDLALSSATSVVSILYLAPFFASQPPRRLCFPFSRCGFGLRAASPATASTSTPSAATTTVPSSSTTTTAPTSSSIMAEEFEFDEDAINSSSELGAVGGAPRPEGERRRTERSVGIDALRAALAQSSISHLASRPPLPAFDMYVAVGVPEATSTPLPPSPAPYDIGAASAANDGVLASADALSRCPSAEALSAAPVDPQGEAARGAGAEAGVPPEAPRAVEPRSAPGNAQPPLPAARDPAAPGASKRPRFPPGSLAAMTRKERARVHCAARKRRKRQRLAIERAQAAATAPADPVFRTLRSVVVTAPGAEDQRTPRAPTTFAARDVRLTDAAAEGWKTSPPSTSKGQTPSGPMKRKASRPAGPRLSHPAPPPPQPSFQTPKGKGVGKGGRGLREGEIAGREAAARLEAADPGRADRIRERFARLRRAEEDQAATSSAAAQVSSAPTNSATPPPPPPPPPAASPAPPSLPLPPPPPPSSSSAPTPSSNRPIRVAVRGAARGGRARFGPLRAIPEDAIPPSEIPPLEPIPDAAVPAPPPEVPLTPEERQSLIAELIVQQRIAREAQERAEEIAKRLARD